MVFVADLDDILLFLPLSSNITDNADHFHFGTLSHPRLEDPHTFICQGKLVFKAL